MRAYLPIAFLLTLVLAPLASAQSSTIAVEPPDPTSTTPVTLIVTEYDTCPPDPVVTRSGFTITVTLGEGPCLIPPLLITHRIELGVLPAGRYTVTVNDPGSGRQPVTATFEVLDANETVRVQPSIGPTTGGTVVEISADNIGNCGVGIPSTSCPAPTVTFGGVPATNVGILGYGHLRATTPPHAPGAVEVRVTTNQGTRSSYAFRYYDPAAPPLSAIFERVLVPVVYNGPGARGSVWSTEVTLRSTNTYGVQLWRAIPGVPLIPSQTPLRLDLPQASAGYFLFVPREAAADIHFNALVRDVSREGQEWGTELPIVREREFGLLRELLNVPLDRRYRRALRLYALGSADTYVFVSVHSMQTGQTLGERSVQLSSAERCQYQQACGSSRPAFALVDIDTLFPQLAANERVIVRMWSSETPVWGFMTLTNNETQHVTVISPQ